ncbi:MAG: hypothetical protein Kow00106_13130 [Anaerolineae bacterium]
MTARASLSVRLTLLLILLGAFALRLWRVGEPSVWHDEGWSIRAIRDPINAPDDNTPPLYYMTLHLLWRGAGDSPLALRYGSVWLDVLTVALAARVVRRWGGEHAALLTAALLALSPLLWAYAREIRAYVAVPLLTVLLLALTERLLANPARHRYWGAVWLAELILLYTHNLSVPVVAWLNLVIGIAWLAGRRWRWLACWVAGQAILLLAYLPWVLGQSPSGTPINTPPRFSTGLLWDIWRGYFAPLPTMIGRERAVEIGSAALGVTLLAAIAVTLRWNRRRPALLALSQAVLLPALATLELQAAHIDFHPRYYVAGVPATMMVLALAAHSLPGREELARLAGPAVLALATGVGAASFVALFDTPAYQHDDFRAIAAHYATLPEDAMIVIPYGWEPALEVYYAEKAGIAAHILGIDLHSSADEAIRAINQALQEHGAPLHVELLTWFQLPADVRGMYPCLLEAAGRRTGSVTVQGLVTTAYVLERPLSFAPVTDGSAEYGALTLSQTAVAGTYNVCLRTVWTSTARSGEDWRVSARLVTLDPPGWTLARSDSDIRDDEQVPTSGWGAGQSGEAFSLLRFPAGAPPGEYAIQTVLFSARHPDGADRLVNGVPAGRTLALATVMLRTPAPMTGETPPPLVSPAEGIALVGHNARGGALSAGQEVRVTLRWTATPTCCSDSWAGATLSLQGEGWRLAQPVRVFAPYSLDWHAFLVPADAEGPAALRLEAPGLEPVTLAQYAVERTERLFAPPPFDVPLRSEFLGVAALEGFSVAQTTVSPDETLALTLVWRVTGTPTTSYRVFTHLLSEAGRVIAQHDDVPVSGARPTTGWMPGEYLLDTYHLVFNDEGRQYRGPARLEVGFYDPQTGARVPVVGGADHVVLPVEITVE